jgi:hypothetical protein
MPRFCTQCGRRLASSCHHGAVIWRLGGGVIRKACLQHHHRSTVFALTFNSNSNRVCCTCATSWKHGRQYSAGDNNVAVARTKKRQGIVEVSQFLDIATKAVLRMKLCSYPSLGYLFLLFLRRGFFDWRSTNSGRLLSAAATANCRHLESLPSQPRPRKTHAL